MSVGGGAQFPHRVYGNLIERFNRGIRDYHGLPCLDPFDFLFLTLRAASNIVKDVIAHAGPIIPLTNLPIGLVYLFVSSDEAIM